MPNITMSKEVNGKKVASFLARIVAVCGTILSLGGIGCAVMLLSFAVQLFTSANQHPTAAESSPHGLDALVSLIAGGIGLTVLAGSLVLLLVSLGVVLGVKLWNRKPRKK